MTQAFNSLGTTVGPGWAASSFSERPQTGWQGHAGRIGAVALSGAGRTPRAARCRDGSAQTAPIHTSRDKKPGRLDVLPDAGSAWAYSHLVLGAMGIFVYVGAEVSIGSFLVNFEENIAGLEEAEAAKFVSVLGGAMLGRFAGALAMRSVPQARRWPSTLRWPPCSSFSPSGRADRSQCGPSCSWPLQLHHALTIFSLVIAGLEYTSQASGILCLAIVGGAILRSSRGPCRYPRYPAGLPPGRSLLRVYRLLRDQARFRPPRVATRARARPTRSRDEPLENEHALAMRFLRDFAREHAIVGRWPWRLFAGERRHRRLADFLELRRAQRHRRLRHDSRTTRPDASPVGSISPASTYLSAAAGTPASAAGRSGRGQQANTRPERSRLRRRSGRPEPFDVNVPRRTTPGTRIGAITASRCTGRHEQLEVQHERHCPHRRLPDHQRERLLLRPRLPYFDARVGNATSSAPRGPLPRRRRHRSTRSSASPLTELTN